MFLFKIKSEHSAKLIFLKGVLRISGEKFLITDLMRLAWYEIGQIWPLIFTVLQNLSN